MRLTGTMRSALGWFEDHDYGHRGDSHPLTMRALVGHGLLRVTGSGEDDTHGRGEVTIYAITDAGLAVLRDAAKKGRT